MRYRCVILLVLVLLAAFHCADAQKDSLSLFNHWLEEGATSTGSKTVVRIARANRSTLRVEFEDRPTAADAFSSVSLPLRTHVLGEDFMRSRPYYAAISKLSSSGVEKQIQMLTVSLMTEIALWDASPIHPWCRFLLKEPKSIGLSTPPILWPRDLVDEIEPKRLLDAVKNRRLFLETFVDSSKGKSVLIEVDTFVNDTLKSRGEARSTFSMMSNRNYLRVRAIIETCVLWSAPGGLLCVPFANFLETQASTDTNIHDRYLKQTLKEPIVRRLKTSTSSVSGDVWSFHPRRQDLLAQNGMLSPLPEVEATSPFTVDEYFATFGRLPTRIPWDTTDCQLIVFSGGMSRERNDVKGNMAFMMDDFLHHYSCISRNDVPGHGLVAAIISVLPSSTPKSVEHCAQDIIRQRPPMGDASLESFYRSLLICLESATWSNPEDLQTVLNSHKGALHGSISLFVNEQFRRTRSAESDESLLKKLSVQLHQADGSVVERHAAVNLRYHRKLIVKQLLERLSGDEVIAGQEDHVEL
ncbi:Hypothetical protein, putative [Bodo saltans]|uniref:Membrane-associated protein n=1 Tax=Bodo saltans TaxID=75058 RepID=A0A0S4IK65_BODSA|nr:Hypothetical protein, putative [Bodo saltans]|eukprot:CUE63195.1 Hypothetical protein, putative [Bodo saltans]